MRSGAASSLGVDDRGVCALRTHSPREYAASLGASLKSRVNYSEGVFYTGRDTAEEIANKLRSEHPNVTVVKERRGYVVQNEIGARFGPSGWK